MSKAEFESLITTLQSLPADSIRNPQIPPKELAQEAENLYHWALQDKEQLVKAGLAADSIDQLVIASGALRYIQGEWFNLRYSPAEVEREWATLSEQAYDLRDRLLHDFSFAFRKSTDVLSQVRGISNGSGITDMIQDLVNLKAIGSEQRELLEKINFDFNLLDKAAAMADRASELLGAVSAGTAEGDTTRDMRNRACTYLKNLMSEVRECGKYVFYRDKKRVRGYSSDYHRRLNRTAKRQEVAEPVAA